MEGHDPFVLAAAHAGPALDGLLCVAAAVLVVADDAAQQAVVIGADPVVVIDVERGQGRHKHAELLLIGNLARQFGIQPVDALHEQDVAVLEFQRITQIFTLALLEVVGRHRHFLAGEQVGNVLIKLLQVKRVE